MSRRDTAGLGDLCFCASSMESLIDSVCVSRDLTLPWCPLRFGPGLTTCHGPIYTQLAGIIPVAPRSPDLAGEVDNGTDQARAGVLRPECPYAPHVATQPAVVTFFPMESSILTLRDSSH